MRKRYSRSYTVLSFLTMFSYREQPFCFLRFFLQDEIRQALALLPAIKSSVTDLRFEQKKASVLTAFHMP